LLDDSYSGNVALEAGRDGSATAGFPCLQLGPTQRQGDGSGHKATDGAGYGGAR
jgi:hypothetical protein